MGHPNWLSNACLSLSKKLTHPCFIGPRDSTAMAVKSFLCLTPVFFEILRSEAFSKVAPLIADVLGRWELAI